jgi:hypothetical protein
MDDDEVYVVVCITLAVVILLFKLAVIGICLQRRKKRRLQEERARQMAFANGAPVYPLPPAVVLSPLPPHQQQSVGPPMSPWYGHPQDVPPSYEETANQQPKRF